MGKSTENLGHPTKPGREIFLNNKNWLIEKDPDAGRDWGQEKGMTEDELIGWHHWLNAHGFEQTLGDSEG